MPRQAKPKQLESYDDIRAGTACQSQQVPLFVSDQYQTAFWLSHRPSLVSGQQQYVPPFGTPNQPLMNGHPVRQQRGEPAQSQQDFFSFSPVMNLQQTNGYQALQAQPNFQSSTNALQGRHIHTTLPQQPMVCHPGPMFAAPSPHELQRIFGDAEQQRAEVQRQLVVEQQQSRIMLTTHAQQTLGTQQQPIAVTPLSQSLAGTSPLEQETSVGRLRRMQATLRQRRLSRSSSRLSPLRLSDRYPVRQSIENRKHRRLAKRPQNAMPIGSGEGVAVEWQTQREIKLTVRQATEEQFNYDDFSAMPPDKGAYTSSLLQDEGAHDSAGPSGSGPIWISCAEPSIFAQEEASAAEAAKTSSSPQDELAGPSRSGQECLGPVEYFDFATFDQDDMSTADVASTFRPLREQDGQTAPHMDLGLDMSFVMTSADEDALGDGSVFGEEVSSQENVYFEDL